MARKMPYTNFHDLNLDWIIKRIQNVYNDENPPPYPVRTVNGQVGNVHLTGDDIPVSPNDNTEISTALASKYVKPAGGIPKSDLSSALQTEINSKYVKPAGGIPKSDLSAGVQSDLNAIADKLDKPSVAGQAGQVLTSDGMNGQSWQTPVNPASIIDDASGYGVSDKTWSAGKLFQMEADILDLENDKIDEPAHSGTAGQVLTLDNSLNPTWDYPTDDTLTDPHKGAPANIVGDLKNKIEYDNRKLDIWGLRKAFNGLFSKVTLPNLSYMNNFEIPLYTDGYKYIHYADLSKNKNESNNTITVSTSSEFANALSSATSGDTIILNDGAYSAISITKSLNIIAKNAIIMPYVCDVFVTTAMNNVYRCASMTSALSGVYDISDIENGIIRALTSVNNVNALSQEGRYYQSSSGLYIHLFEDKVPTSENVLCDNSSINPISVDSMTENGTVYIEGITVIGGGTNIRGANSSTYTNQNIIAKDCRFLYARTSNAVTLLGVNGYFQNCEAGYAYYDGFNYHDNNSIHSYGLEIDCIGHDNGHNNTNLSCNGTTTHDGSTIIRIGGVYYNNNGGNVADIHSGTTSYNYDCLAFDSEAPFDTDNNNEFHSSADFWAYNQVIMYLYGCRAVGDSQYNLMNASSTIYVDKCEYTTNRGTITPIV